MERERDNFTNGLSQKFYAPCNRIIQGEPRNTQYQMLLTCSSAASCRGVHTINSHANHHYYYLLRFARLQNDKTINRHNYVVNVRCDIINHRKKVGTIFVRCEEQRHALHIDPFMTGSADDQHQFADKTLRSQSNLSRFDWQANMAGGTSTSQFGNSTPHYRDIISSHRILSTRVLVTTHFVFVYVRASAFVCSMLVKCRHSIGSMELGGRRYLRFFFLLMNWFDVWAISLFSSSGRQ